MVDDYLWAKNLFLRRHQQRAGEGPGLTRFRDYLDRGETIGEKRKKSKLSVRKLRYDRMLSLATSSAHLQILELRVAPQKSVKDWRRLLNFWHRRYAKDYAFVRFVVHFIQKNSPSPEGQDFDRAGLRRTLDRQSAILQLFRRTDPHLGAYIVGIDVANLERGFPPQYFAPYLELLRGRDHLIEDWESDALENWCSLRVRGQHIAPSHRQLYPLHTTAI